VLDLLGVPADSFFPNTKPLTEELMG